MTLILNGTVNSAGSPPIQTGSNFLAKCYAWARAQEDMSGSEAV